MSTLLQLQNQFQDYITADNKAIHAHIVSTETVPADTRLSIYKTAYQIRLIDCLKDNYPGLHLYLGDEEFDKLALDYLKANPSSFRSVRWFGDKLPYFIKSNYDEQFAYLVELTDFEWKMTLAFDAADRDLLTIEDMIAIAPEAWGDLCFSLHPSVQRMSHFWNATPIRQALVEDRELPTWQKNVEAIDWVLYRACDFTILFYSLSKEEAWALDAIERGLPFSKLCEGLCKWLCEEEVGLRAASFLKGWILKGMLIRK